MRISLLVSVLLVAFNLAGLAFSQDGATNQTVILEKGIEPGTIIRRDSHGNRLGSTHESQRYNGTYVEHRDNRGKAVSYSRNDDSTANTGRVIHFSPLGQRIGYSESTKGFFGERVMHYDSFGRRIGSTAPSDGISGRLNVNRGKAFAFSGFRSKAPSLGRAIVRRGVPVWVSLLFGDVEDANDRRREYAFYALPWLEQTRADMIDRNNIRFHPDFWRIGSEHKRSLYWAHYGAAGDLVAEAVSIERTAHDEIELVFELHPSRSQPIIDGVAHVQVHLKGPKAPRLVKRQEIQGVEINEPFFFQKTGVRVSDEFRERGRIAYTTTGFRKVDESYSAPIDNTNYSLSYLPMYRFYNRPLPKFRLGTKQSIALVPGGENLYKIRFKVDPETWIENEIMFEANTSSSAPVQTMWRQTVIPAEPCRLHPRKLREVVFRDFAEVQFQTPKASIDEAFRYIYSHACAGVSGHYPDQTTLANALGRY